MFSAICCMMQGSLFRRSQKRTMQYSTANVLQYSIFILPHVTAARRRLPHPGKCHRRGGDQATISLKNMKDRTRRYLAQSSVKRSVDDSDRLNGAEPSASVRYEAPTQSTVPGCHVCTRPLSPSAGYVWSTCGTVHQQTFLITSAQRGRQTNDGSGSSSPCPLVKTLWNR